MNQFVGKDIFDALLNKAGHKVPATERASERLRTLVNKAVWQLFSRLVDIVRISADSSQIRPDHVYNVMRLATLLRMPLQDSVTSRQVMKQDVSRILSGGGGCSSMRGGAETTLPASYFSGESSVPSYSTQNYTSYTSISPSPQVVRGAIDTTFSLSGGGSGSDVLTDASINLLLQEYKARLTSSQLRIGDSTRKVMKRILENNVIAMLKQTNAKKPLSKVMAKWCILL